MNRANQRARVRPIVSASLLAGGGVSLIGAASMAADKLPPSPWSSAEAQVYSERGEPEHQKIWKEVSALDLSTAEGIRKSAEPADAIARLGLERMRKRFAVTIQPQILGGVQTDIVEPVEGIPAENRHRVLINLHGGGFVWGGRLAGQLEAVPIASVGRIRVVAVDYRKGPDHRFPAASEDVAKVYRALLARHRPEHIGIYGCSAGALLTVQSVAWLKAHELPVPGAIAIDGKGGVAGLAGDSYYLAGFANGRMPAPPDEFGASYLRHYFRAEDLKTPLASPALYPDSIKSFPPTLVLSATRDASLSSSVFTHRQLYNAGVPTELHVWEGVGHCFSSNPDLPESQDLYRVLTRFFEQHTASRTGN